MCNFSFLCYLCFVFNCIVFPLRCWGCETLLLINGQLHANDDSSLVTFCVFEQSRCWYSVFCILHLFLLCVGIHPQPRLPPPPPPHTHTHTHTHYFPRIKHPTHVHACTLTYIFTHTHTHTHTHMNVRAHAHKYTCTHKCIHAFQHGHLHAPIQAQTGSVLITEAVVY